MFRTHRTHRADVQDAHNTQGGCGPYLSAVNGFFADEVVMMQPSCSPLNTGICLAAGRLFRS